MKIAVVLGLLCGLMAPVGAQFGPLPVPDPNLEQRLTGRVVSPDGVPVAGARLQCVGKRKGSASLVVLHEAQSDAEGNYRLDFNAIRIGGNEIHSIWAAAPGWGLTIVPAYAIRNQALDVRLVRATTLRFTFVDSDGNLLPNVPVRLTAIQGQSAQSALTPYPQAFLPRAAQWRALTGADGTCEFANLPQGYAVTYELEDEKRIFAYDDGKPRARSGTLWLGDKALKAVAPEILVPQPPAPSASITGRVLFPPPGKPLTGANVSVLSETSGNQSGTATGPNGEFRIGGLPAGQYTLICRFEGDAAKNWTTRRIENVTLKEGQQLAGQDFKLIPGAIVKGRVLEEGSSAPVGGASVYVYPDGEKGFPYYPIQKTAADGSFQVRVPGGKHIVTVRGSGNTLYSMPKARVVGGANERIQGDDDRWRFEIADGQTLELEFRLRKAPPLPVEVTVLGPDGAPLEGATVVPGSYATPRAPAGKGMKWKTTDAAGRFMLDSYWLANSPVVRAFKGNLSSPQGVLVAGNKVTLRLEECPPVSVRGTIVDEAGKPLPLARVQLSVAEDEAGRKAGWSGFNTVETGTDGSFSYANLRLWADFSYRVSARARGCVPAETATFKIRRGEAVQVPPLRLSKATGFVAGRVVNLKNQPVAGATVECNGDLTAHQVVVTDAAGRFRFDGVIPELLSLGAQKDYRTPQEMALGTDAPDNNIAHSGTLAEAGRDNVTIKLRHF